MGKYRSGTRRHREDPFRKRKTIRICTFIADEKKGRNGSEYETKRKPELCFKKEEGKFGSKSEVTNGKGPCKRAMNPRNEMQNLRK